MLNEFEVAALTKMVEDYSVKRVLETLDTIATEKADRHHTAGMPKNAVRWRRRSQHLRNAIAALARDVENRF